MSNPIVILGNGCAASEGAIALRKGGYKGRILMLADNHLPPANPMLTTYYASGRIAKQVLFPYGMDFYEKYDIEFHGDEPAVCLMNQEHRVQTGKGTYEYSQCLVATGASAILPPIPGCTGERILTVRTPGDASLLKRAGEARPGSVLVAGASMVGIKVVEMFCNLGARVTLADLAPYIFPLAAGETCAHKIGKSLEDRGIGLMFSSQLKAVEHAGNGRLKAVFGDGQTVGCDYLAMCVGVRTNLEFLRGHSLAADRGILVDSRMRSSDPDVFAAGDVAQAVNLSNGHPMIIGLLANARDQGRTAGSAMIGKEAAFSGSFAHNITHFFDIDFVGIGDVKTYDEVETFETDHEFCQFFYTGGHLTGLNTLGKMLQTGVVKHRMMKRVLGGSTVGAETGRQETLAQFCALSEAGWRGRIR